jgi:hypothetical protein
MKIRRIFSMLIVIVVVLSTAALNARAKRMHVESRWRDVEVIVDGAASEWRDPLVRFNDQPISFATTNDSEFLYVVFVASEPQARMQILRQGLIVWFDGGGGEKKRLGIKYPIGRGLEGGYRGRHGQDDHPTGDRTPPEDRPERQGEPEIEPPNRLEVLGPDKNDARSDTSDRAPGIEVKTGQADGILTYELKVPLQANDAHPHAVGAKPGAVIGLGLEMPKLERPEESGHRGGMGGGGMGGGGMGGMGGMGRRGGRHGGGGNFELPKPLGGWVSLQLAGGH